MRLAFVGNFLFTHREATNSPFSGPLSCAARGETSCNNQAKPSSCYLEDRQSSGTRYADFGPVTET